MSDAGLTYKLLCNLPTVSAVEVTELSFWLHKLQAEPTHLVDSTVDIT